MTDLQWEMTQADGWRVATVEGTDPDTGARFSVTLGECTERRCHLYWAMAPDGVVYLRHGENPEALWIYQPSAPLPALTGCKNVRDWTERCHAYEDSMIGVA